MRLAVIIMILLSKLAKIFFVFFSNLPINYSYSEIWIIFYQILLEVYFKSGQQIQLLQLYFGWTEDLSSILYAFLTLFIRMMVFKYISEITN